MFGDMDGPGGSTARIVHTDFFNGACLIRPNKPRSQPHNFSPDFADDFDLDADAAICEPLKDALSSAVAMHAASATATKN